MRTIHHYGWRKSHPNFHKKLLFELAPPPEIIVPALIDLRTDGNEPPIYDQGQEGSCTGNANGRLVEALEPGFMPSRNFLYYNGRAREGTTGQDCGAEPLDVLTALENLGVCSETDWPYDTSKFAIKPSDLAYANALLNKKFVATNILQDLNHLGACLAQGFRFSLGITVFESFESEEVAQTGMVPIPGPDEQEVGGHDICIVGKMDSIQRFIVANSWGDRWGDKGYCYLPYAYVLNPNLSADFFTLRKLLPTA